MVGSPNNLAPLGILLLGIGRIVQVTDFFALKTAFLVHMTEVFLIAIEGEARQFAVIQTANIAIVRKATQGRGHHLLGHTGESKVFRMEAVIYRCIGTFMNIEETANIISLFSILLVIFAKGSCLPAITVKTGSNGTFHPVSHAKVSQGRSCGLNIVNALLHSHFVTAGLTGAVRYTRLWDAENLGHLLGCASFFTDSVATTNIHILLVGTNTGTFRGDNIRGFFQPAVKIFRWSLPSSKNTGRSCQSKGTCNFQEIEFHTRNLTINGLSVFLIYLYEALTGLLQDFQDQLFHHSFAGSTTPDLLDIAILIQKHQGRYGTDAITAP